MACPRDRFAAMVRDLLGEPAQPPPDAPGRIFLAPRVITQDPFAEAWEAEHRPAAPITNDNNQPEEPQHDHAAP